MALVLAAVASALAAAAAVAACITTPPPDLPVIPYRRPTILHDSVQPPSDRILSVWPAEFEVPVKVDDPSVGFEWNAFVDYDPAFGTMTPNRSGTVSSPVEVDSGVTVVPFQLLAPDARFCHHIEFQVAHSFQTSRGSPHTPDSLGGDSVTWTYNAGGGPNGCPVYDAGAVQDGAFLDAPVDGLPVVAESGGDR